MDFFVIKSVLINKNLFRMKHCFSVANSYLLFIQHNSYYADYKYLIVRMLPNA
ncbi:MAG: hypothetical protein BWX63_00815 [Bacteroidetes bacterium ADurb.Bin041]|jgi:hypothetical protein|nr:MAG: hypothetical protein BWX63_00815 [Bacteroidetes bacterium ADurb.Bin041]